MVLTFLTASANVKEIRIGVLAFRGSSETVRLWKPTADYLSNNFPKYRFNIIPLDHPQMKKALSERKLEYILTNTGHYVELEALYGVTRIATVIKRHDNFAIKQFGAVIFTRANRNDIKSIKNLRGKSLMAVKKHAFGGFRMAWAELLKHGVDPFRDLKSLEFSGFPVDKVVYAVRDGKADVGTFRTGTLERLHQAGKINIKNYKILGLKRIPGFPLLNSTDLYPEWPFAQTNLAPTQLTKKLAIALLKMNPDSSPSRIAGLKGWTVPMDYMKVHDLYKKLKVGPYKNLGKITFNDFLNHYWHLMIAVISFLAFLVGVLFIILRLDKKVRQSEYSLARAQEIGHIGNWEWDVEKNELQCSSEIYGILGLGERGGIHSIDDFLVRVHDDDREFVKATINDALYHGKGFSLDHKILISDGSTRIVHEQAEIERDETGNGIKMSGIMQDITERKTAEENVRESRKELATILNNMQDTFFRLDTLGRVISVSPSVHQLLGHYSVDVTETRFTNYIVSAHDRRQFYEEMKRNDGQVENFEIALRHKNGLSLSAAISAHYYYDNDGDLVGVEGVVRNISELVLARDDLAREKERVQTTLESIGDGVITTNLDGSIDYMNAVAQRLTGWDISDANGETLQTVFNIKISRRDDSVTKQLERILQSDQSESCVIHNAMLINKDKERYFLEVTITPIRGHNSLTAGSVIIFHDVTEVRELAKKMAFHAKHDALTGLINRQEFEEQLEHAFDTAKKDKPHAVLFLDLVNFKQVNETCGRAGGDELLRQVASSLKENIRDIDELARIGSDEFALFLRNCPAERAKSIGETLTKVGENFQFSWKGEAFNIGFSIGIAPFNGTSLTIDDILNAADSACNKAKTLGNSAYFIHEFDNETVGQREIEKQWIHKINSALDEQRMRLYAQQVIPLNETDGISHYEVLVRMEDEQGGLVLPMAFLPAAERYHLISKIDRWVFEQVLQILETNNQESKIACSINLSGQSIHDPEFREFLEEKFKETNAPLDSLCIEISETDVLSNFSDVVSFINSVHHLGVKFALDSYGVASTSFNYLQSLPVDCVKLDGTLIRNILSGQVEAAIVEGLNLVAQSMGKKTVAKCVENKETFAKLKEIGVNYAQGFELDTPQPFTPRLKLSKTG